MRRTRSFSASRAASACSSFYRRFCSIERPCSLTRMRSTVTAHSICLIHHLIQSTQPLVQPRGGMSPGALKGTKSALKYRRYTAEAIARRRELSGLVRAMKALAKPSTLTHLPSQITESRSFADKLYAEQHAKQPDRCYREAGPKVESQQYPDDAAHQEPTPVWKRTYGQRKNHLGNERLEEA
jgi:hypothetical protein